MLDWCREPTVPLAARCARAECGEAPGLGPLVILCGLVCVQASAALSAPLFSSLGVTGVVSTRLLFGAVVLLGFVRPSLRGRSRADWVAIVVYGLAMSAMTVAYYNAVDRLPLGTASTLMYLGPFGVAVASIRRRWEIPLPVIALAGVVLISRPSSSASSGGIAFGLLGACAAALYTLFAQRLGHSSPGLDGFSLSTALAAVLFLPFSAHAIAAVDMHQLMTLASAAFVGVALGYGLDFSGIRLSSARVASTIYSLEPAIAAVLGAVILGQTIERSTLLGMALVIGAGVAAASTVASPSRRPARD